MNFLIQRNIKGFKYWAFIWTNEDGSAYELEWQGLINNASKWPEKEDAEGLAEIIIQNEYMELEIIKL